MYFFFQAEDGIRDLVRSRGLGDVYKRQHLVCESKEIIASFRFSGYRFQVRFVGAYEANLKPVT